jgi:soluble lytic murein transglycosylase-like protein
MVANPTVTLDVRALAQGMPKRDLGHSTRQLVIAYSALVLMAALWPGIALGQTCTSLFAPSLHWRASGLDAAFEAAGQRFRIDPDLGRAIAWVESSGNATAVSPKGAQGLMQLMPGTSDEMRVINPFNSYQSIYGGMEYLRRIANLPRFAGDLYMALVAYNAGPNRVTFPAVSYYYADTVKAVYWRFKEKRGNGLIAPTPIGYLRMLQCGRAAQSTGMRIILSGGKLAPSRHY